MASAWPHSPGPPRNSLLVSTLINVAAGSMPGDCPGEPGPCRPPPGGLSSVPAGGLSAPLMSRHGRALAGIGPAGVPDSGAEDFGVGASAQQRQDHPQTCPHPQQDGTGRGAHRHRRPPYLSATHLWPQPVTAPDVHPGRLCRQSRPGGGDPALSNAVITSTGSGEETVKVAALNCSTPETATAGCTTRSGTDARFGQPVTYRCISPQPLPCSMG